MKSSKRKTFSELNQQLPPVKELTDDTKLPYVFDLLWDVKTYRELMIEMHGKLSQQQLRMLRENGFKHD